MNPAPPPSIRCIIMGPLFVILCLQSLVPRSVGDGPTGTKCPVAPGRGETCVCLTADGIIDLTPLSNTDGTARFSDIKGGRNYNYAYNPCSTYQDSLNKGACDDVHMCQSDQYVIGGAPGDEEIWIDTDGSPYAYYEKSSFIDTSIIRQMGDQNGTGLLDDASRVGVVNLFCDHEVNVEDTLISFIGESPRYHYHFNLTSCQVCPGGCHPKHTEKKSVAGAVGLTIILLLIVGIITYFVAGVLVMKFYKKASGTDLIPNKGFWITAPLLVKDGFIFTFGPCVRLVREKIRTRQGYSMN